jgi:hypothetical protein
MLARFGERIQFDGVNLYVFWPSSSVATADETELREIKVGYRAKSFLRVPQFFSERPDVEDEVRLLSREEAAKRLLPAFGKSKTLVSFKSVGMVIFGRRLFEK